MGLAARCPMRPWPLLAGILLVCIPACDRHPLGDGLPAELSCTSCHGSENNAAPPRAVNGATSTAVIAVGAHQSHVNQGAIAGPVGCEECHPMPTLMDGDHHPDPLSGGTVVQFIGPIATTGGASPVWDPTKGICTNVYCHGANLAGTSTPKPPRWTKVDGSQIKCDSCHANTPTGLGASHPFHANYTCNTCHANVASANLTIVDPSLHVDGKNEVNMAAGTWDAVAKSCADTTDACHGSGSIPW
jgi:predicted CxxxxCH...CXXCH cytochrome family protein